MKNTIQLFEFISAALNFLSNCYEEEVYHIEKEHGPGCYPDHLIKHISKIENAVIINPRSFLYNIIFYDMYIIDILDILGSFPRAAYILYEYKDFDGSTAIDLLKHQGKYESLKYRLLRE